MARLQPNVYIEFKLAQYPASLGTTTYRWALRPLADPGAFKEYRLVSLSPISRRASDIDGNYFVNTVTAVLNDQDGVLRTLLQAGTTTEYFTAREVTVFLISETGRGVADPRPIFRGWVSGVQPLPDRLVELEMVDVIGSQFSAFNLDKTIGSVFIRDIAGEKTDEALRDIMVPIYCGMFSDEGAVDANGETAEKGLNPVFNLGERDFNTGQESTVAPIAAPTNIQVEVHGSGDSTYYYFFSLITPYGESRVSEMVTVNNAPSVSELGLSNYIELSGTYDPGPNGENRVRIWGRSSTSPTTYLDSAFYDVASRTFYYNDGAHPAPSPTRADVDHEKPLAAPKVSYSLQSDSNVWSRFLVCLGYSYEILSVFASDLAADTAPKRVKLPQSVYGSTVIRSQDAGWPHADPWIEENGIRYTAFYARGPIVRHHVEGIVTMAVNMCGPHDDANLVIDQAGRVYQWALNEHVLKNGGTGYRSGAYGPLETYSNGDSMLNTVKFDEFQDVTIARLGDGVGYTAAFWLTEPTTVREVLRRTTESHGCQWAHNHFGQIFPFVVNDLVAPTSGRHFRRHIEIHRPIEQHLAHDEVRNRQAYVFHWDIDGQDYRFKGFSQKNDDSIAAHTPGGVVGTNDRRGLREGDGEREMFYVNAQPTADDVVARSLARRSRRLRYVSVPTDLTGLEYEITSDIRITDHDGLGSDGDVATKAFVLGMNVDIAKSEVVLFSLDRTNENLSVRVVSEEQSIHISDSVQASGLFPTEQIRATDTVTAELVEYVDLVATPSETVVVGDSLSAAMAQELSAAVADEGLKLSDAVPIPELQLAALVQEELRIADTVTPGQMDLAVTLSEGLKVVDYLEDNMGLKSMSVLVSPAVGQTYTVPAGITKIRVRVQGPGGGGGGGDGGTTTAGAGAGGDSGAYAEKVYAVTPGQTFQYSVYAGGTGATAGNNSGLTSTATTFDELGSVVSAGPGVGGGSMATGSTFSNTIANAKATATGGDVNISGGQGLRGWRVSGTQVISGHGAPSMLGSNGGIGGIQSDGQAGSGYGAGGGGGASFSATDRAGGAGAPGVILVEEYGV